jgi:hypothetical protein
MDGWGAFSCCSSVILSIAKSLPRGEILRYAQDDSRNQNDSASLETAKARDDSIKARNNKQMVIKRLNLEVNSLLSINAQRFVEHLNK